MVNQQTNPHPPNNPETMSTGDAEYPDLKDRLKRLGRDTRHSRPSILGNDLPSGDTDARDAWQIKTIG